jgi:glyoxylase-like metal-dependent hydrolase (beta-lactamase superfamily II)
MNSSILQVSANVSRQYLINGSTGFLLIDTGLRQNYNRLINFIRKQNVSLKDIKIILITHADGDHFGCLDLLLAACPNAISAASEIEAKAIMSGNTSRPLKLTGARKVFGGLLRTVFATKPAQINRILKIGETLPYLGSLEVLDTKGHTPGHISLWSETTRTLFSGDSIRINGNELSPSTGMNNWDEDLSRLSFEAQLKLKPETILGGHGTWEKAK